MDHKFDRLVRSGSCTIRFKGKSEAMGGAAMEGVDRCVCVCVSEWTINSIGWSEKTAVPSDSKENQRPWVGLPQTATM